MVTLASAQATLCIAGNLPGAIGRLWIPPLDSQGGHAGVTANESGSGIASEQRPDLLEELVDVEWLVHHCAALEGTAPEKPPHL
jgi:hypothetical protein